MSLTYDEAVEKIRKLMSMADHANSNPNEAALAASRAASIMQDYQISEAALSTASENSSIPITSHVFERNSGKKIHWRMKVAAGVAKVCNCMTYWHGPEIRMIGRDLDVKGARYLFDLICPQVESLAQRAWQAEGYGDTRRFMHAFRLGCSVTIYNRLIEQANTKVEQMRTGQCGSSPSESSTALMVINQRIAKVDEYASRLGLRTGRGPTVSNRNALAAGKEYGNRVNLGNAARGQLNSPKQQIRG